MKDILINLILSLFIVCPCFGKLHHGMSLQMTTNGTGLYYKQLWSLTNYSQFINKTGVHFDKGQLKKDIHGYYNSYQTTIVDLTFGYRRELFIEHLSGIFRPILVAGTGMVSNNENLRLWMIKYILGFGIQFYRARMLNEIMLQFKHSELIERDVALEFAFYWK